MEGSVGLQYKGKVKNGYATLRYDDDHLKWGVLNGTRGNESARCDVMNRCISLRGGNAPEIIIKKENGDKLIFDEGHFHEVTGSWFGQLTKRIKMIKLIKSIIGKTNISSTQ